MYKITKKPYERNLGFEMAVQEARYPELTQTQISLDKNIKKEVELILKHKYQPCNMRPQTTPICILKRQKVQCTEFESFEDYTFTSFFLSGTFGVLFRKAK